MIRYLSALCLSYFMLIGAAKSDEIPSLTLVCVTSKMVGFQEDYAGAITPGEEDAQFFINYKPAYQTELGDEEEKRKIIYSPELKSEIFFRPVYLLTSIDWAAPTDDFWYPFKIHLDLELLEKEEDPLDPRGLYGDDLQRLQISGATAISTYKFEYYRTYGDSTYLSRGKCTRVK